MADEVLDQTTPNRLEPNRPVSQSELLDLGVLSWHVPPTGFDYPAKAVPWEPSGIQDPALAAIRTQRGYSYADIITCSEECLPDYHNKLKSFFQEHIHSDEEVRYILGGSGYFDIRDRQNRWVRMKLNTGDVIVLPEGCYHRFTMDESNFTHAMRLFKGVPVWTPINRPADEHESRQRWLDRFMPLEAEKELRQDIVSCLRSFFQHGWCFGSSGAMGVLVGSGAEAPMLVTPSGVPKELLLPEDLFLLTQHGKEQLKNPAPRKQEQMVKVSDSAALFAAIFAKRPDVRAISHVHSVSAVLAAGMCEGDVLRLTDLEMIKGLGVANTVVLEVPIVPNQPTEPELVPSVIKALEDYPAAQAILVREHGVYVFGKSFEKAKIATECLNVVLEVVERQPSRLSKRQRIGPSVILLDIEGTTTPISFVKDKLFPFAAANAGAWLKSASPEELTPVIEAFREQARIDGAEFTEAGSHAIPHIERLTQAWIAADRKVSALKDFQGLVWRSGYERAELKGEMFDDTPKAMDAWRSAGRRVAIFSSGSREAQRLIFKYSDKGDLTGHISAYFDPKSAQALKQDPKAYLEIALSLGISASEGMFCTDILGEAVAAQKAGWSAVLLLRAGNAPLPPDHGFRTVSSLLDV